MANPPPRYRRRNTLRHIDYDYTQAGAYFVTICTEHGQALFGQVVNQVMVLNALGDIADQCWNQFSQRHDDVVVDAYVIMPNHVHTLLWIKHDPSETIAVSSDKTRKFGDAIAGSLSSLVGGYKSAVTQQATQRRLISGSSLWQRNFWDHIVRSEQELARIREYIQQNPARWKLDRLYAM